MSFVGSVGQLVKNSGLDILMKTAFVSVQKIIELLRTLIDEDTTQNDMIAILQDLSNKNRLPGH